MVFQNNFIYFQEQYTEHLLVALARFYGSSHYKLENWCRHYFLPLMRELKLKCVSPMQLWSIVIVPSEDIFIDRV